MHLCSAKMRGLLLMCLFGAVLGRYGWDGPQTATPAPEKNECMTDTASCGCCLMQRQITQTEQHFNTSLDDLHEKVDRLQAVLNNIRSSRSAFTAALTEDRKCTDVARKETTLAYESVLLNLGGNYDRHTGVYTAPRSGVYVIALTVYSDAGAPGANLLSCATLRVGDQDVAHVHDQNDEDQEDSGSVALLYQLTAGNRLSVVLPAGCSLCDNSNHYNTFSAFLLYATD